MKGSQRNQEERSVTPNPFHSAEAAGWVLRAERTFGTFGRADCCRHLGLKMLSVFVLLSAGIVSQTAAELRLDCVNDYLFTINCSLNAAPGNASEVYWLFIVDYDDPDQHAWCRMREVDGGYSCSINKSSLDPDDKSTLNDIQMFNMSLCPSNVSDSFDCDQLIEEYKPEKHIKLNAPCCLGLTRNSSRHHFTWRSTYEAYSKNTGLTKYIWYQFRFYTQGQGKNILSHDMTTEKLSCSVSDLIPGAEYGARVRSRPNQGHCQDHYRDQCHYQGQWSDWSAEIHWKTEPAEPDVTSAPFFSGLGKELFILFSMVLLLLLSFACVQMWRRRAYIPTPAPYFHTLFNDYHGDFKSWVVTGDKTAGTLKAEEILRIDTLTKCVDVQEEEPQRPALQEATYNNIPHPGCDSSLLGVPYAVSTLPPAEDESRCWECSKQGPERGSAPYNNEYCTLSAFHRSHSCSGGPAARLHAPYQNASDPAPQLEMLFL